MKKTYLIDIKKLLISLFSILWLLSVVAYNPSDPGLFQNTTLKPSANAIGLFGAYFADTTLTLFGYSGFGIPVFLLFSSWISVRVSDRYYLVMGWVLLLLVATSSTALFMQPSMMTPSGSGGLVGMYVLWPMLQVFGFTGSVLTLSVSVFISLIMIFQFDMRQLWQRQKKTMPQVQTQSPKKSIMRHFINQQDKKKSPDLIKPSLRAKVNKLAKQASQAAPESTVEQKTLDYQIAISLLQKAAQTKDQFSQQELNDLSRLVENKLNDFGISVSVENVYPGPVITRFELNLAAGTKVSRLSTIATDLARSLSVDRARVVEVIPGKSVVGLELPNPSRDIVYLSEILASESYEKFSSPLSLALGKDIAGYPVVVDLMKMPHLLVAGTSGSGKSVGLNTMLVSMLYKSSPDMLKLILIDPKMLELAVYADIPHLLTPVVTDMNNAAASLRWCVGEMERRYQIMVAAGVRNISGFNEKVQQAKEQGLTLADVSHLKDSKILDNVPLEPLPYIVVVADEFADMMMVVGKKVEQLIARLAQKARAAGIHLVFATQRPSVDVITGLIKANIPTRIAFQVTSKIDSRTILDQGGAEQLLGHGDMLYQPPGTSIPMRIHGAYVTDDEVHAIVAACKKYGKPDYVHFESMESVAETTKDNSSQDELYNEAVEWVKHSGKISVSSLQRRFRIGYNRSSCIVEAMEANGIVSPPESSGARKVLIQNEEI